MLLLLLFFNIFRVLNKNWKKKKKKNTNEPHLDYFKQKCLVYQESNKRS